MKKAFQCSMIIILFLFLGFFISCQKQEDAKTENTTQTESNIKNSVPKNATGTFTFNKKAVTINYVYTWYDTSNLDETVTDIHLVFSDNPVPNNTHSIFDLQDLGREEKIHGLKVVYMTGGMFKDTIVGGNIFHKDIADRSLAFGGGWIEVELTTLDESIMEGKIFTQEPQDLFDHTFELNISFKASLPSK